MSILIKMEMPKSCGYCPLRHEARDGDECYLGASLTEYQKRPDDCPLVELPPHGRLGDLDILAKQVEYERFHHAHTDGLAARHHIAEYGHFLKVIFDVPTIIPAETTLKNEIKIIDTKGKPNYDPKHRFVIPVEEGE